ADDTEEAPSSPAVTPVNELQSEIIVAAEREGPRQVELTRGRAMLFSARSPGKTTANEDAALLVELHFGAIVIAVADGCGGMPGGGDAAAAAVHAVHESVRQAIDGEQLTGAIIAGFDAANRAILDLR